MFEKLVEVGLVYIDSTYQSGDYIWCCVRGGLLGLDCGDWCGDGGSIGNIGVWSEL